MEEREGVTAELRENKLTHELKSEQTRNTVTKMTDRNRGQEIEREHSEGRQNCERASQHV